TPPGVTGLIQQIEKTLHQRQEYAGTSLVNIMEYCERNGKEELFDIIVVIENYPLDKQLARKEGRLSVESYAMTEMTNYDLTVGITLFEGIELNISYDKKLFEKKGIVRMTNHFKNILQDITSNPRQPVTTVKMMKDYEIEQLLYEFNDTEADYPRNKTIHQLFEEQAEKTPDNIGLVGSGQLAVGNEKIKDKKNTVREKTSGIQHQASGIQSFSSFMSFPSIQLTYKELNDKSNRLARHLKSKGVKPDTIVAIMLERSIEMIIGLLGILKAGGAYLPIDLQFPRERKKYILKDSNAKIVLKEFNEFRELKDQKELNELDGIDELGEGIEAIDIHSIFQQAPPIAPHPETCPHPATSINHPAFDTHPVSRLAYIIYTSGSSGQPKGVLISHRNVIAYLGGSMKRLNLTPGDTRTQTSAVTFDHFVEEVYHILLAGGKLLIVSREDSRDVIQLVNQIKRHQVTVMSTTPAMLKLLSKFPLPGALRQLITGGDVLKREDIAPIAGKIPIFNYYGPTETTVSAIYYSCPAPGDIPETALTVPIGRPMGNYKIYILDRYDNIVPNGVEGEICIAGDAVAAGYLNKPELTAERFVKDRPRITRITKEDTDNTLYKTGDLGRWLVDGNIEFLGRIDHQVKVRGYRIELGEIEIALQSNPIVKEAMVTAKKDSENNNFLTAYYILKEPDTKTGKEIPKLREFLSEKLPAYMVPSYFIPLEKFPLTPNGKIDRKALPEPETTTKKSTEYVAPTSETEKKLAAIWQQVLGNPNIGTTDNFFEIGGHSLKAINVIAGIEKTFEVTLPLPVLFAKPYITEQAHYIESSGITSFKAIEAIEEREYYPVSAAQKRMYTLNSLTPDSVNYNITGALLAEGELSKSLFEGVFEKLINRHESLRTSFHLIDGNTVQRVHSPHKTEFRITLSALGKEATAPEQEAGEALGKFLRPFTLSQAPLMRVELVKLEERKHIVLFDTHHIIADGISMEILINEFSALYAGQELPPLTLQYKDYTAWQKRTMKTGKLMKQKKYWQERYSGEIPVLAISTDYTRPPVQSFEGDTITFEIDESLTAQLKELTKNHGATIYITLLTLYNILLSRYSGQEDIIVGSPSAGRRHIDLENIIGMFVNTVAIRNDPQPGKSFIDFLKEVRQNALEAFENQDYQFDDLLEHLDLNRESGRNPLFDTMFTLQTLEDQKLEIKGLTFKPYEFESKISKFDITMRLHEGENILFANLDYCVKLFKKETMTRFVTHFEKIIEEVVTRPTLTLANINILSETEAKQLLYEFNDTQAEYPRDKTIHQLFEEQVERTPDHISVVGSWQLAVTYRALDKEAQKLAVQLKEKNVKPGTIVGIMAEHSLEMIIGIIAILKAGAAYMPLDPEHPADRIVFMLKDSNTPILLTTAAIQEKGILKRRENAPVSRKNITITTPRPPIEDFDSLPHPDRSLVDYEHYNRHIGQAMVKDSIAIQATRGCPYKCAYCHRIWSKRHTVRSAENIFDEVNTYYQMGIRRFVLLDDIFNLNRENYTRFLKLVVENNLDIRLFFPNGLRGDLLTKDEIDLMVKAGTVSLALALETASPRLQKLVKKKLHLEKLRENLKYICEKYPHVLLELFTMHGFPTETNEEALQTLEFIKSLKWVHFPYVNVLKIYPNTEMHRLALEQGVSEKEITASRALAYHELPATLPFTRTFTLKYQSQFLNDYFLAKERLLHVLPYQAKVFTEAEIIEKYDSYLPGKIEKFEDLLHLAGISPDELGDIRFLDEKSMQAPQLNFKLREHFKTAGTGTPDSETRQPLNVLLLDLSLYYSGSDNEMLYNVVEPPLGLMYLLTYLKRRFGPKIKGKIAKSRVDFDNHHQLKTLLQQFKPDVIGVRTLTLFNKFFHQTIERIRGWGIDVPIIAGGPYASSDYQTLLADRNINLAVLGEGEITFNEIIGKIIENNRRLPSQKTLQQIPGIAYLQENEKNKGIFPGEIIVMDQPKEDSTTILYSPEDYPQKHQHFAPGNPAYVIYTSGTTGKPKAVVIAHRSVVRLVANTNYLDFNRYDRLLQTGALSFDASTFEIWGALENGLTLYMESKENILSNNKLKEIVSKYGIDVLWMTSALFNYHVQEDISIFEGIKHLLVGGDVVSPGTVNRLRKKYHGIRVTNGYGPTENTTFSTSLKVEKDYLDKIPIGKPISNSTAYIVNKNNRLCPIGVPGELLVGGDGLAYGYLNNPELTAEKFINYKLQTTQATNYKQISKNKIQITNKKQKEKEEHGRHGIIRKTQK
ncbi:MAG: amino acid adenylation domain-containing protein, partial [bacterium]|nr:amino acid adenylation domain-containing protein [bacterium]